MTENKDIAEINRKLDAPRWMNLKKASWYSSIGRKRLKALAIDGAIAGFKDPDSGRKDWIFDRVSIDSYRQGQRPKKFIHQKAVEILKSVK